MEAKNQDGAPAKSKMASIAKLINTEGHTLRENTLGMMTAHGFLFWSDLRHNRAVNPDILDPTPVSSWRRVAPVFQSPSQQEKVDSYLYFLHTQEHGAWPPSPTGMHMDPVCADDDMDPYDDGRFHGIELSSPSEFYTLSPPYQPDEPVVDECEQKLKPGTTIIEGGRVTSHTEPIAKRTRRCLMSEFDAAM